MKKKNKSYIIKLLIAVTILSLVLTGCNKEETNSKNQNYNNSNRQFGNGAFKRDINIDLSELKEKLKLTEEQAKAIERSFNELSKKQAEIMKELKKDMSTEDRQKIMEKNMEIMNEGNEKLAEILTKEQMDIYIKMIPQRGQRPNQGQINKNGNNK